MMSADRYDVVVVGGGPAGSAAAWRAAGLGLNTLVLDRASFPRDKPCGDGVTPRAVKLLQDMGLEGEFDRFHRVDGFRLVTEWGVREQTWAHARVGLPDYALVARRTDLDEVVLKAAQAAGAEVRQGVAGTGLVTDGGRVTGVIARVGSEDQVIRARVVIGADGATSRMAKAAGLGSSPTGVVGFAARAELQTPSDDDRFLEVYPSLLANSELVPAYGWVFPMGGGAINIGVGFVSTSRHWKDIKVPVLVEQLVSQLPSRWNVRSASEVLTAGSFGGWKLPMGITVQPMWRPGFLVCGDAAGVAKPFTGAGISKALQSGLLAAEAADDAIRSGHLGALEGYELAVRAMWGRSYTWGARFAEAIGSPLVMKAFVRGLGTDAGARLAHLLFSQAIRGNAGTDVLRA